MSTNEMNVEHPCTKDARVSGHLESHQEEHDIHSGKSVNNAGTNRLRNLGKRVASAIWKTIAKPIIGNAVSRAIPWRQKQTAQFTQGVSKYGMRFSSSISNLFTSKTGNLGSDQDIENAVEQKNNDNDVRSIQKDNQDQNTNEEDEIHDPVNDILIVDISIQKSNQINNAIETECAAEVGGGNAESDESTVLVSESEEQVMHPENPDEILYCASSSDAMTSNNLESECYLHEIVPKRLIRVEVTDDNSDKSYKQTLGECYKISTLMETECGAETNVRNADNNESTYPGSEDQDTKPEKAAEKFLCPSDAFAAEADILENVPLSALRTCPPFNPLDFELKSETTTVDVKRVAVDISNCCDDATNTEVSNVACQSQTLSVVLDNSTKGFYPGSIPMRPMQYYKNGWKRRKTVGHPTHAPSFTVEAVDGEYQKRNTHEDKSSTVAMTAYTSPVVKSPCVESLLFLSDKEKLQSSASSKIGLDLVNHSALGNTWQKYEKAGLVMVHETVPCISYGTEECVTTGTISETKSTARQESLGVNYSGSSSKMLMKLDSNDQCERCLASETKESAACQVESQENTTELKVKHEERSQLLALTTHIKDTVINQDGMLPLNFSASKKKRIILNWTQDEDRIIFEAVSATTEGPFKGWKDLVQRLPCRNVQQIRNRWNQLNPKINRSRFSQEDDVRLWNGHKALGSRWSKISVEHFDSTRSSVQLMHRWKHPLFKEFINKQFGPDAYEIRNNKGVMTLDSSCHVTRLPDKIDESSTTTSKTSNEIPGVLARATSEHIHAAVVPVSNDDNFRVFEVNKAFGAQRSRISVEHFKFTPPWYQLNFQMLSPFEASVGSRGSNFVESLYKSEGAVCFSSVQADPINTASRSSLRKTGGVGKHSCSEHHQARLSICFESQKPIDWGSKGVATHPTGVKRKIDYLDSRGIHPKKSKEVNVTNDVLLKQPNKNKILKVGKKKSDPINNTYLQIEENQTNGHVKKTAGTEAERSFLVEAVSKHGVNIKPVGKTSKTRFKLEIGDLVKRYVDDGDDDEYPLVGVLLNFDAATGKYTIRYSNSTSEALSKKEFKEKVLVTVPRIDDGEKVECFTPLHIVSGRKRLLSRIADDSMDRLGHDIIHHIASFLPSLESLISFCSTSKQASLLLKNTLHSETLFCRLFANKFGEDMGASEHLRHLTWKDRWRTVSSLRRGFHRISDSQSNSMCTISPRTVGVLPQATEESAILYDNPQFDSPENEISHGYFGMQILNNLPKPPNATEWEAPLIVHGDFNGVKIFSSVGDLSRLSECSDRDRFLSLGDDYGCQVLSLILSPSELFLTHNHSGRVTGPPCCFIGYASGCVGALRAKLTDDGMSYTFILSSGYAHSCEVSCLAIVNCRSNLDQRQPVLFSACCGGKVYYYPHALEENHRMESELAFSNVKNCPIFSMVSIEIDSDERNFSNVLCIGDRSGTISLWTMKKGLTINGHTSNNIFSRVGTFKGGRGNHPVTAAKMIRDRILVTGNTNGDLRFWNFECAHTPKKGLHPRLTLQRYHRGVHTGAVEVCMNVGDVLLTSGGNDGNLVGWDINSLSRIGKLQCHPGKKISLSGGRGKRVVNGCVISAILPTTKDARLICLCRDGVLVFWSFNE